jgi:putative resolvase
MIVSIGEAAEMIGVAVSTLRRWETEGRFHPAFRTSGNHRRYRISDIKSVFYGESASKEKRVIAYARVSSHDQKEDLKRQESMLAEYCRDNHSTFEIISDLGSGINYRKRGLNKLLGMICSGSVEKLILTHRDRLLRFGSPLIFRLCHFFGTEVVVLHEKQNATFEQELVADVIEIMTVFTSKLYGRRSHQSRKKILSNHANVA